MQVVNKDVFNCFVVIHTSFPLSTSLAFYTSCLEVRVDARGGLENGAVMLRAP